MLMPGIGAASLPRAPLPRMEPFPGAGGITKGASVPVLPLSPQPGQQDSALGTNVRSRNSSIRHWHHSSGCSFRCCPVL